jgi:hypothetical protein
VAASVGTGAGENLSEAEALRLIAQAEITRGG